MSDTEARLLQDAVARLLADVVSPGRTMACEEEGMDRQAWNGLARLGLVGPDAGALTLQEISGVLQATAYAGALVPFTESEALGRWLSQQAGLATDAGEILSCLVLTADQQVGRSSVAFGGARVAWGRHCSRVVLSYSQGGADFVALVRLSPADLRQQANLAGEPADIIVSTALDIEQIAPAPKGCGPAAVRQRGAFCRSASILGAAQHVLELAIRYAADRKQFGKSLSQFQVIASYLALMAGELAATSTMLESCLAAQDRAGELDGAMVAVAKIQAGKAASSVASLSHQIHGAMGFTQEYPLHLWTRRLWAWREEFGNETEWAMELGGLAVALGADGLWERITG